MTTTTTKAAPDDVLELWTAYKADPHNRDLRNSLVEQYLPLVKYNGERIWARLPEGVEPVGAPCEQALTQHRVGGSVAHGGVGRDADRARVEEVVRDDEAHADAHERERGRVLAVVPERDPALREALHRSSRVRTASNANVRSGFSGSPANEMKNCSKRTRTVRHSGRSSKMRFETQSTKVS